MSANYSLYKCLRHPADTMAKLYSAPMCPSLVPAVAWAMMTSIAILGSLIFGWSAGQLLPSGLQLKTALWFALSAGIAWCLFGPILVLVTKRSPLLCAHACLVSMTYGEGVLMCGAALNIMMGTMLSTSRALNSAMFTQDSIVVILSNIVMALSLAVQLKVADVPVWRTLLTWNLALNGFGIVLFTAFGHFLLHR